MTGSKLTDAERTDLDGPLVINELDDALKKANLRSAPGIDSYSYRFISKFWNFLGTRCLDVLSLVWRITVSQTFSKLGLLN